MFQPLTLIVKAEPLEVGATVKDDDSLHAPSYYAVLFAAPAFYKIIVSKSERESLTAILNQNVYVMVMRAKLFL